MSIESSLSGATRSSGEQRPGIGCTGRLWREASCHELRRLSVRSNWPSVETGAICTGSNETVGRWKGDRELTFMRTGPETNRRPIRLRIPRIWTRRGRRCFPIHTPHCIAFFLLRYNISTRPIGHKKKWLSQYRRHLTLFYSLRSSRPCSQRNASCLSLEVIPVLLLVQE